MYNFALITLFSNLNSKLIHKHIKLLKFLIKPNILKCREVIKILRKQVELIHQTKMELILRPQKLIEDSKI